MVRASSQNSSWKRLPWWRFFSNQLVFLVATLACGATIAAANGQLMRLPEDPDLSPDGKQLAFAWHGDVWIAPARGGQARQITSSSADDDQPKFSPDGKQLAFISKRTGKDQIFVVPLRGGVPEQVTFHSEGCSLEQWTRDGESFLISARRDHFWRRSERFFTIENRPRPTELLLFDAYGSHGRWSPDGGQLLFAREGVAWWRKGYRGSQASQIWRYDPTERKFAQVIQQDSGARSPLWHPDGKHLLYVGGQSGSLNLWQRNLESSKEQQLTHFEDDSVVMPCIAPDGKAVVFRHRFDFYRLDLAKKKKPELIALRYRGDRIRNEFERATLKTATDVAFSDDGLEIAFVAGGDLWVMDTVLREPRQVTATPEAERDPVFAPDGSAILFISDAEDHCDIWSATRDEDSLYWWQNESFTLRRLTHDAEVETSLTWSPDGEHIGFVRGLGDLWLMDAEGENARRILTSWSRPDYDWSPDGKWIVYAQSDNDFNRDIFLLPLDESREPFNLSSHPDVDDSPVWSPDGKAIAFSGRRVGEERDIYFVYLQKEEDEISARDRKLKEAIEKIEKARAKASNKDGAKTDASSKQDKTEQKTDENKENGDEKKDEEAGKDEEEKSELPEVMIDFEDIHDRIRRVSIADTDERGLLWSHDSKKLAFSATIDGKKGTYTISPPGELDPKLLSSSTGSQARWISRGNQIVWLSSDDIPASLSAEGKTTTYSFSAHHEFDPARKHRAIFDLCWRIMRDRFYDENLNNRNWTAVRDKYAPLAEGASDRRTVAIVVNMMLGELNASHMGFSLRGSSGSERPDWTESTAHLGVRFDRGYKGPGLKIRDVIYRGPADKQRSELQAGELILAIDDQPVDITMDLTAVLNGRLDRDIHLRLRSTEGKERSVTLRPISYSAARSLLYEQWIRDNQATVERLSQGRFGYTHISGMNMTSFYRFERELYSVAAGKDGLVIDVRDNGGGHTTDRLLTILTQPEHAITVPRGGGPGYPQDRRVYATWHKPIVVLCNQNSFSNAEIFSHAIKTLKRGRLVGVPTSGSVISTGGTSIMDVGYLRLPFRGWYLLGDGQDMELNGAVPDHLIWPRPGEMPAGTDTQLKKALQVLKKDVKTWKERPKPELIKSSSREKEG